MWDCQNEEKMYLLVRLANGKTVGRLSIGQVVPKYVWQRRAKQCNKESIPENWSSTI